MTWPTKKEKYMKVIFNINVERIVVGFLVNIPLFFGIILIYSNPQVVNFQTFISLILITISVIADVIIFYFRYMIQRHVLGHNDNQLRHIGNTISHLANKTYKAEEIVEIMEPMRQSALTENGMLKMINELNKNDKK